jgi:hypothetical protein
MGDFNFPELRWGVSDLQDVSHPFVECLANNFLYQLVDEPTRQNNYLYLVLTSDESMVQKLEVSEPFETSDHQMIRFSMIGQKEPVSKVVPKYNYFKVDYEEVRKHAETLNWKAALETKGTETNCVNEMWSKLQIDLSILRDKYVKLKKQNKNKCKWVTKRVTRLRRAKKRAWNNYVRSGKDDALHEIYKKKLKLSTKENNKAKREYEERLAENIKNDTKSFYAYINNKGRTNKKIGPLKDHTGQIVSDNKAAADLLNQYFSSVFTVEDTNIMPVAEQIFTGNNDDKLTKINISEEVVLEKLSKINVNKCQGPDQIHGKFLYELRDLLCKPITKLCQLSLELGTVPQDWRDANVAPLFKKGSRGKPENYRPVSLTSIVGKLMESIIKDSIVSHLEKHKLIADSQHGFTSGKSCLTNLLEFFEVVTKNIDDGNSVDLLYLDFSKAFDKVPYIRLFKKIEAHGISGDILLWIKNWLRNRRQNVCVEGEYSNWASVTSGVPQGSVLGPVLFIIYINDLESNLTAKLAKFADDSKLCKVVNNEKDAESLKKDLEKLEKWSSDWQMQFNTEKCSVMHLGNKNKSSQYSLNNAVLKDSTSERDLGVIIDKTLKFSEHCDSVASSANATLGMIRRGIACKSKSIVTRLYKALVRPKLEYCVQAWRPFLKKDIDKIENVQHRATKMIEGCRKLTYEDRLRRTGLTTLEERRTRGDLIEVFKMLKGLNKVDYKCFFQLAKSERTRGHVLKLAKARFNLEIRKNYFSQRVVNEWNKLPAVVIEADSVNSFKNRYDKFMSERKRSF